MCCGFNQKQQQRRQRNLTSNTSVTPRRTEKINSAFYLRWVNIKPLTLTIPRGGKWAMTTTTTTTKMMLSTVSCSTAPAITFHDNNNLWPIETSICCCRHPPSYAIVRRDHSVLSISTATLSFYTFCANNNNITIIQHFVFWIAIFHY